MPDKKPDKSLADKAIDIKGKKYVQVADRIRFFNDNYPNGCIQTCLISKPSRETGSAAFIVKASVTPDVDKPERVFTAYSQQVWNTNQFIKGSDLELAETSSIGRCLGFMGIGIVEGIASADEVNKAQQYKEMEEIGRGL